MVGRPRPLATSGSSDPAEFFQCRFISVVGPGVAPLPASYGDCSGPVFDQFVCTDRHPAMIGKKASRKMMRRGKNGAERGQTWPDFWSTDRSRGSGRHQTSDSTGGTCYEAYAPPPGEGGGCAKTCPRGTRGMIRPVRVEGRYPVTIKGCPQTGQVCA